MQIISNDDEDIFRAHDEEMKRPEMYTILCIIYMHYTHYIYTSKKTWRGARALYQ